jgi:anthranilate phosphoribosyltransferase
MVDGIQLASKVIESGAAKAKLQALIKLSGELAAKGAA